MKIKPIAWWSLLFSACLGLSAFVLTHTPVAQARDNNNDERGAPPDTCAGDVNHDGNVGIGDVALIIQHWGETVPPGTNGDANGDGFISLSDIARVIADWGRTCNTCGLSPSGGACFGTCFTPPGSQCLPVEVIRERNGQLRYSRCACVPPTGGVRPVIEGDTVVCVGTCGPGLTCAIRTESRIDGTTVYTAECVPIGFFYCITSADKQSCIGICPPGLCCKINTIRKTLAGTFEIVDCQFCVPCDGCSISVAGGVPGCGGACGAGQSCNLSSSPVSDGAGGFTGDVDLTCSCGPPPAANPCPPAPELGDWNGNGPPNEQDRNNCYNYGTNKKQPAGEPAKGQPGRATGGEADAMACQDVKNAAMRDGLIFIGNPPAGQPEPECPPGTCKVFLVVQPGKDYHWYRKNGDGTWSHKPGLRKATTKDSAQPPQEITDPRTADRRRTLEDGTPIGVAGQAGYTDACGYMCVTAGTMVRGSEGSNEDDERGIGPNEVVALVLYYSGIEDPGWVYSSSLDVADLNCRIAAAIAAAPGGVPDPNWEGSLGMSGVRLMSGVATGLPEQVTAFRGMIEVTNGGFTTYYPDVKGLGEVLRCRAIAEGYADLVPAGPCGPAPSCP
ncbi:MAG TPA: dockerin type I domain-containing protein [Phycisphaerales bacterium]|nr:dockerin type I domain-containing protein [Phycisphaerales bacterium]